MTKGKPPQKVIVPFGLINENDTAVIEIPPEYKDEPVVVVTPQGCSKACPNQSGYQNAQGSLGLLDSNQMETSLSSSFGLMNSERINCTDLLNPNKLNSTKGTPKTIKTITKTVVTTTPSDTDASLGLLDSNQMNSTCYDSFDMDDSLGLLPPDYMSSPVSSTPKGIRKITKTIVTTESSDFDSSLGLLSPDKMLTDSHGTDRSGFGILNNSTVNSTSSSSCPGARIPNRSFFNLPERMQTRGQDSPGMLNRSQISSIRSTCPSGNIFNSQQQMQGTGQDSLGILNQSQMSSISSACPTPNVPNERISYSPQQDSLGLLNQSKMSSFRSATSNCSSKCRSKCSADSTKDSSLGILNNSALSSTNSPCYSPGFTASNISGRSFFNSPQQMQSTGQDSLGILQPQQMWMSPPAMHSITPHFQSMNQSDYKCTPLCGDPLGPPLKSSSMNDSLGLLQSDFLNESRASGASGNLTKSIEDQLRITEANEQAKLQSDLKSYQEARRKLVIDTAKFGKLDKSSAAVSNEVSTGASTGASTTALTRASTAASTGASTAALTAASTATLTKKEPSAVSFTATAAAEKLNENEEESS